MLFSKISKRRIEQTDGCRYFGSMLTKESIDEQEIRSRITKDNEALDREKVILFCITNLRLRKRDR